MSKILWTILSLMLSTLQAVLSIAGMIYLSNSISGESPAMWQLIVYNATLMFVIDIVRSKGYV